MWHVKFYMEYSFHASLNSLTINRSILDLFENPSVGFQNVILFLFETTSISKLEVDEPAAR